MSRDKHKKASDIFRESNFIFAQKGTFAEAFPEIARVVVRGCEKGRGVNNYHDDEQERSQYYSETSLGEYIDCSNPLCYNGGFGIGRIIRDMVSERELTRDVYEFCQGYEGSPKGRRKYGDCDNTFKAKIEITYRPDIT